MDWNNGTIFRAYISAGDTSVVDAKLDIAQQELNGKVFIGIENFVLKPNATTQPTQDFWASTSYLQFESFQLTPYIDFFSDNSSTASFEDRQNRSRNTSVFARLPLIASPTLGAFDQFTESTFALDRVLNKDSILYEMRNNPNALSNGRLRFRLLDQDGDQIPDGYITSLFFTLVVYKPRDTYN